MDLFTSEYLTALTFYFVIFGLFFGEAIADALRWLSQKVRPAPAEHDFTSSYSSFSLGGRSFSVPRPTIPKRTGSLPHGQVFSFSYVESLGSELDRRKETEESLKRTGSSETTEDPTDV